MTSKLKLPARKTLLTGASRRSVLKGAAAAAAASTIFKPAILRAADNVIKIGHVAPLTGPLAFFAEADGYLLDSIRKTLSGGLELNGKTWQIEIIEKDSQTDVARASEVANELILSDEVDIITACSSSAVCNPVADAAELAEIPCITADDPWESYYYGRNPPPEGFTWTYHFFWGLDQVLQSFVGLWDKVDTNKVVGTLFNNQQDDNSWHDAFIPFLKERGYTVVDPGQFPPFGNDFTTQIAAFKKAGCDIITGNQFTPDWGIFWSQCAQQGFHPKIANLGKAFLFPSSIEALGERSEGVITELWWSPYHPYKSSLTGESSKKLCDDYEKTTGRPWTCPIGFKHAVFEVVVDVLKRAADVKDREAILDAITKTKLDTVVGPIEWNGKPVKNVCATPVVAAQWQRKDDKWSLEIVDNTGYPEIPITAKMIPLA